MSFLGSFFSPLMSMAQTAFSGHVSRQNATHNADLERSNWQYMQSNAHQLEIDDLKNAGLNPILSATNSQLASMPSVSGQSVSDNGIGAAFAQAASAKELKSMDLENRKLELQVDALSKGIKLDKDGNVIDSSLAEDSISADTFLKKSQAAEATSAVGFNNAQKDYYVGKTANELNLTKAQVDSIYNNIYNSNRLTDEQIASMRSKRAVDDATIKLLSEQAKESVARTSLTYEQRRDLISQIDSATRKLENLSAEQRFNYLNTPFGDVWHEVGFGLELLNPFSGFSIGKSGTRVSGSK